MPEKISIMRESGDTLSSNIVALFSLPDTEKQYIITTENAVDPHGLTVLHVSEIVDGVLKKVATDEEWTSIKTIMRSIISGNAGAYKFIPMIKTAKAEAQYSRDISVSAAASKQMTDSYTAAIASTPDAGGEASAPVAQDTNEITPGISEVAEAPAAPAPTEPAAPTPAPEAADVGNAVTNIPADAVVSTPKDEPAPEVKEEVKEEVAPAPAEPAPAAPAAPEASAPAPTSVASSGQTPVVAYVDPAFQQLLTSDYNQILMHVQNINNNINQIAAMPALNYQPSYSANPNGSPNFNPNATVDEIIMGSTEVFNEGVKNLVATITEKLYRDLQEREADLKKREEMLLEREKMLNEQLSKLPSNAAPSAPAPAPKAEEKSAEPAVNVVSAPVKIEEEKKAESTVPAQQNTAPVAEPAPKAEEKKEEAPAAAAPVTNSVPQPVQTVEIV